MRQTVSWSSPAGVGIRQYSQLIWFGIHDKADTQSHINLAVNGHAQYPNNHSSYCDTFIPREQVQWSQKKREAILKNFYLGPPLRT